MIFIVTYCRRLLRRVTKHNYFGQTTAETQRKGRCCCCNRLQLSARCVLLQPLHI